MLLGTPRHPVPVRPTETVDRAAPSQLSASAPEPAVVLEIPGEPTVDAPPPPSRPTEPPGIILDLLVKRGDTLEVLFRRNGLSLTDLAAMVALPDASGALKLLKPGDRLEIAHRDGQVLSLRRELDDIKLLSIAREESGFAANTIEREVDIRTTGAHGEISELAVRSRHGRPASPIERRWTWPASSNGTSTSFRTSAKAIRSPSSTKSCGATA